MVSDFFYFLRSSLFFFYIFSKRSMTCYILIKMQCSSVQTYQCGVECKQTGLDHYKSTLFTSSVLSICCSFNTADHTTKRLIYGWPRHGLYEIAEVVVRLARIIELFCQVLSKLHVLLCYDAEASFTDPENNFLCTRMQSISFYLQSIHITSFLIDAIQLTLDHNDQQTCYGPENVHLSFASFEVKIV